MKKEVLCRHHWELGTCSFDTGILPDLMVVELAHMPQLPNKQGSVPGLVRQGTF
jgi:hypothetical protein